MARASRRNSSLTIHYNGQAANSLYGLADRVGQNISRMGRAEDKARKTLKSAMVPMARKEVRERYTVTDSVTAGTMRAEGATRRIGDSVSLWASAYRIPLAFFGGAWGGRSTPGATAAQIRGAVVTYAGAFMAKGRVRKQARKLIYKRVGAPVMQKYGRYKGQVRQSIQAMKGPSVLYMIRPDGTPGPLQSAALNTSRTIYKGLTDLYVDELVKQIAADR